MRRILDHLGAGVALFDGEGRTLLANRFILERFGELKRGSPYYEGLKSLALISAVHDAYAHKKDGEGSFSYGGRSYRYRTFYAPEGVGLLVEDVSDREQFERLKEEFLSTVSHELKTPLSVLLLSLETLEERLEGKDRELLRRSKRRLLELQKLVEGVYFLTLNRLPERKHFSVRRLVEEVLEELSSLIREKKLNVRLEGELELEGDERVMRLALKNLLENAVKFNREGGSVEVKLERRGRLGRVTVRDEGRGIERELLPAVKEPFIKGEESEGLGLGLALAERAVRLHGGRLEIKSSHEGTTAEITLPLTS
ncbi:MAG: HAMP domain-containing histidine kinase [Aquificae bacterium]|nr:HAMP domain-containing histidine kinase [Aquificota bacterium]